MKILIIYNDDTQDTDEADDSLLCYKSRKSIESVAKGVSAALETLAYKDIRTVPIRNIYEIQKTVAELKPDLVFNLCESINGDVTMEIEVASTLESLGVAYTGNSSLALSYALDKFACNEQLSRADMPVPYSYLIESLADLDAFEFSHPRYIIKPNDEDGSTGIDADSVVESMDQLRSKVQSLYQKSSYRLIIQEFIDGRELNFAFIGAQENIHWCASEIIFNDDSALNNKPNILCYVSKWEQDSEIFKRSKSCPAVMDESLKEKLFFSVAKAAKALGITSYARIDFKISLEGQPYIIDVNPNCDLDRSAGMALSNQFNGITYEQLIKSIVLCAKNRE